MTDISFTPKAYCKIILHAAKYPYCAVNGVLLAKPNNGSKEIHFVDAVPLFHVALNLTPMAEIALTQIDHAASQMGLVIAGYYTAHENFKENSLEKAHHRISEKIAENFGSACLVVVDNTKLSLNLDNLAIKVAQFNDGKYKPADIQRICLSPDHTLDTCTTLLNKRAYETLVDFDNHLDDVTLDWMNPELNEQISIYSRE